MFARPNDHNKILSLIILASLAVKLALFGYGITCFPSFKFMPDTPTYINPGINLAEKGVFAVFSENGRIEYEILRTPGYPLFLGFLTKILKLSLDAVIVVQILLITFAGYIVYKAAKELDGKIALLAAFIFLFDLPVTMTSLLLLSESLYTVFIAVFMYVFLKYLRSRSYYALICSAVILAGATYIRPISYYLGFCVAAGLLFIEASRAYTRRIRLSSSAKIRRSGTPFAIHPHPYRWEIPRRRIEDYTSFDNRLLFSWFNFKKAAAASLIFLAVFYGLVGVWNYRNYARTGNAEFSVIGTQDLQNMGLTHKYERESRTRDNLGPPFLYYVKQAAESVNIFFTRPGTLKYLRCLPIKIFSKIYGYPWVVFWIIGLFFVRYNKPPYGFLLLTILYFMAVSVIGVGLCVGSRFRAPVMPLIAILSAAGWSAIYSSFKEFIGKRPATRS